MLYIDKANNLVQTTLSLDQTEAENLGLASANDAVFKNVVDGKGRDFVLIRGERLALYNENYELKFASDFDSPIVGEVKTFVWNKKNYLVPTVGKEIYILGVDGEVLSGFPVYGQFSSVVSDLDRNGSLELITSDKQGLVLCYGVGL